MTVIVGAASSRSNSKTKAPGRMSLTKLRQSSGGQGPSSTLGGQPLESADKNAPRDIKHRFEITRKLGSGTYGKVSLAYDHKTEREVAVKLIKKSAIENKQDLVRIRREIRIMSMLKHPNIIQIYEVFENKDKIILVMEYASGGELYDYVSKFGSLPEGEARRVFRQITSAILYCHKHKVAHRDLKLENILLDIDNNAKIADFGLSNYFNEKTLLHTFCGSPLYASPEIINGTPYLGPEVDCWSLGILLYTLVYGSMPFDGHDFNRMVRQIKRGAYYEPDTPSTASMLIRNMLRVNAERRADIDEIASHWWLNLEENMPVIQELPENQIIDHTPLTERAETMVVQDLANETDVFMEFGHLSAATRQKIEEFRRRRQHAEEYNETCPIKPSKTRKTDEKELTSNEKSLRGIDGKETAKTSTATDAFSDPLERLRQLETRLQTRQSPDLPSTSKEQRRNSKPNPIPPKSSNLSPTEKEPEITANSTEEEKRPQFVSASKTIEERKSVSKKSLDNGSDWKVETDSLNMLMNQVLEQMDKGPVSINLVARVKAHPSYDQRPMVKELLESIISAQPAFVRKETSKVIDQAQTRKEKTLTSPVKTQAPATIPEVKEAKDNKYKVAELPTKVDVKAAVAKKLTLEERKWHSVEVGFETDEESSSNGSVKVKKVAVLPKNAVPRETRSAGHTMDEEEDDELEDESEYEESEIDELADVVEHAAQSSSKLPLPPKIVENLSETQNPPQQQEISDAHLSTLERGLVKRISKGKYQHHHIESYGRGVSTEASTPPAEKPKIGGPQPTIDQSPVLFDKASRAILNFPEKLQDSDDDIVKQKASKQPSKWTKSQDPDITDKSATATPTPTRRISDTNKTDVKQATKPQPKSAEKSKQEPIKNKKPKSDSEEEEESEDEGEPIRKPRTSAIIGFRTIQTTGGDGSRREAPIVEIKPQAKPYAGINAVTSTPDKEIGEKSTETSQTTTKTRASVDKTEDKIDRKTKTSTIAAKLERRHSQLERRNSRTGADSTTTTGLERRNSRGGIDSTTIGLERKNSRVGADTSKTDTTSSSYRSERRPSRDIIGGYGRTSAYADQRKSFHEYSPVEHDDFATVYGAPINRAPPSPGNFGYGVNGRNGSRFGPQHSMDEEVFNLHGQMSGLDSPGFHSQQQFMFGNGPPHSQNYPAQPHISNSSANPYQSLGTYPSQAVAAFMATQGMDRPSSNYEPPHQPSQRFAVYQTRAEREAKEAANARIGNYGSDYRQNYNDRPVSSYIGGSSGGYKSRYDDYSTSSGLRRPFEDRSFEMDPFFVGPPDYMPGPSGFGYGPPLDANFAMNTANNNNRFRPVSRRLGAGIRDVDGRRARARSHSSDQQKFSGTSIDVDAAAAMANRMMTPDNSGIDYAYVNYHDTGNSRSSQAREPDVNLAPTRGILKNKQAFEIEPRASQTRDPLGGTSYAGFGLRRHMSAEKDLYMSPFVPSSQAGFRFGSIGPSVGNAVHHHAPSYSVYAPIEVPKTSDFYEPSAATKKRNSTGTTNFLNTTRRRTAEIRLGNDGKLTTTTNGYLIDDDYSGKRPRSPIDRIKSLFGGTTSSTKKTTGGTTGGYIPSTNGISSRYTSAGATSTAGSSQLNKRYTGATNAWTRSYR